MNFYIFVGTSLDLSLALFFFAEEDWPWANIHCQFSSFCLRKIVAELTSVPISSISHVGCHHSMVWCAVCRLISEPGNPRPLKQSMQMSPSCHWVGPWNFYIYMYISFICISALYLQIFSPSLGFSSIFLTMSYKEQVFNFVEVNFC